MNQIQATVGVEGDVLGQGVEQLRHGFVAPQRVLYDPARVEQAHVPRAVDDVDHEEDVGGEVVPGPNMEALEGDEVEVEGLEGVVHHDEGELEDPSFEGDVPEAP